MRINKNIYSLNIYRNYTNNIGKNSTSLERISSGKKINAAKDNPIKIEKSENFKMQIRALQMSEKNVQDGISMIQTIDSATGNISEILIRMKELAVQAANESNSENDKNAIQIEINQLGESITSIANNTNFNGNKMINNENITDNNDISEFKILQIGVNRGENIELPTYNLSSECLKVTDIDVSNSEGVDKALKKIDNAIVEVNKCRSVFGSLQSRMESTSDVLADSIINIEGGLSNIMDADIAFEMAEVARSSVLIESSLALMAQSNNLPNDVLNILSNLIK